MEIYLIRHGLAGERGDHADDDARPLTPEGEKKTAAVAGRLKEKGIRFDLTLTSPLVRAKQTASILLKAGLTPRVEEFPALRPGGNIEDWSRWLSGWGEYEGARRLALVGHEPDLSGWAELLVWGANEGRLSLKKAGVIGISGLRRENPLGTGELFLLMSPKWLL